LGMCFGQLQKLPRVTDKGCKGDWGFLRGKRNLAQISNRRSGGLWAKLLGVTSSYSQPGISGWFH